MAWTQRQANPWVVLPDVARTFDMGGGEARILVSAEQSGGAWWLGSSMHSKVFSPYGWMASGTTGALVVARLGGRCTRWETVASSRSAFWFREILRDLRFFPDLEVLARHLPHGSPQFFAELKQIYAK